MALPGTLSAASAEWSPPSSSGVGEGSRSGSTGTANSWHKKYVKNVTKGVSTLLWGHTTKHEEDSTFDSPTAIRTVIDWSHVTYPTEEAIPTLDFHVARKACMSKRSKNSSSSALATKPPLLHARHAKTAFSLSPPLMLEPGSVSNAPTNQLQVSHVRNRSRWSVSGSSMTGASGTAGSSTSLDNIYRCVEALGVISVVPFGIVQTDLFGEITHQVQFRVTHLLHAVFGEVLGIGEALVCVTAAFTIAVYRVRDLELLYDIPVHLAENCWLRYYRSHTCNPPSNLNDCRISALAISPSSFSRRHGLVAAGSCSGLTHVWKIPDQVLVGVLPPPLSRRQNVAGLAFASVDIIECIRDIASPFVRPETSETLLRQNYIVVFYMDGHCALWSYRLSQPSGQVYETTAEAETREIDILPVGCIPTHMQFYFPSIEMPLRMTEDIWLDSLVTWRKKGQDIVLELVLECGDCIALFVKVGAYDFGFIFVHPQCLNVVQPLITFQEIGIPIAVKYPAAVCYALLRNTHRCLVVATPGVLRIIRIVYDDKGTVFDDTDSKLIYDMSINLQLISTLPVIRKTEFCKAKYDADFDELLLGLITGEIVRIDAFSELVLRA